VGLEDNLLAVLVIGPKLSGDAFAGQDFKLFGTLANQTAVALQKAELYRQVKDYSLELEKKVSERTRQVAQLQVEQEQMMLDISHALQTPLTVLKNELASFRQKIPADDKLFVFERSIEQAARFTYDLLKLARLESIKNTLPQEPIDLSEAVSEVAEYVNVICRERDIAMSCQIEPQVIIDGDREKLEDLVTNLLSNAIKYISNGTDKRILLKLKRANNMAELIVEDSGMGISPEDLPNIFRRFYRRRQTSSEGLEGTGLGLAICKRIVEMHKGTINVQSIQGKGTTFTVRFPSS
jgi:two-component system sensor histidine kinase VicK